jgi:hypothetical protein
MPDTPSGGRGLSDKQRESACDADESGPREAKHANLIGRRWLTGHRISKKAAKKRKSQD